MVLSATIVAKREEMVVIKGQDVNKNKTFNPQDIE